MIRKLSLYVILLIASALTKKEIKNLSKLAKKLNLEVLVEIHSEKKIMSCLPITRQCIVSEVSERGRS